MATKLYLHDNALVLSGTFPTGEQDAVTADFSATGAATLRELNQVPGAAMANRSAATSATTSAQSGFMGMWATPPLSGSHALGGGAETLAINIGADESNLSANLDWRAHAYVWRPSTGAVVGDLCAFATSPSDSALEPTAASSIQVATFTLPLSSVAAEDGDVIIVELWASLTQAAASSYTVRAYYDGSAENATEQAVVSDHAAFFEFSQTLSLQLPEVHLTQQVPYVIYDDPTPVEVRLTQQVVYVIYAPSPPPIELEGSTADQVTVTGGLSTSIDMVGESVNQTTAAGDIVTHIDLDGNAEIQVSTSGDLTSAIETTGHASNQVTATGALATSINMAGQAADQVDADGNINTAISLTGKATVHSQASGELTGKKLFKFVVNHVGVKGDVDFDTQAARRFYGEVRKFAERTKPWQPAIFYETKPDEVYDVTLVSQRVYGRRDEYLAVMAAAGIDNVDQPLKQKRLVLPTESQLYAIKRQTGFESIADLREGFGPVWAD
jgi:hypothetical protein